MKVKIPHAYVLIFYIIIALGLASYFIPAGNFNRQVDLDTGIEYVVPGTYRSVEASPVSPFKLFQAIPDGMMQAGDIVIFVLIIGGSFGIINATGTINKLISAVVRKNIGKETRVIPMVMIVFSLAGAILGMAEEVLPLYPIFITLALALGFDSITGVAMILLGTGSGFVAGFLNPFTTGIAQGIADIPLFSGMLFRLLCYLVIVSTTILYVYYYSIKIKKNPSLSPTFEQDKSRKRSFSTDGLPSLTKRDLIVVSIMLFFLGILVYGVFKKDFYVIEISTIFLIMGILCGIAGNLSSGRIALEFIKGSSNLVYGALIIGLAKGIMVVMEYGNIMDTFIFVLSKGIEGLPPMFSAVAMFVAQSVINLFISSGSGQAAVSMPIMTALADLSGVTRQTSVLAFQFGDGFSNVISPTSGYFMAALAIGRIQWKKWAKWMFPLFAIWCILGGVLLIIATIIEYGPY